jgi:TonB family protein
MKGTEMKAVQNLLLLLAVAALSSLVIAQTGEPEKPVVVSAAVPVYPAIAEAARAVGDVMVEVDIDREGRVTAAHSDGKIRLLGKAAEEAARRWQFATSLNGEKRRKAQLVFSFRLMPEETSSLDSTPVFYPPYRIEIRKKPAKIVQTPSY